MKKLLVILLTFAMLFTSYAFVLPVSAASQTIDLIKLSAGENCTYENNTIKYTGSSYVSAFVNLNLDSGTGINTLKFNYSSASGFNLLYKYTDNTVYSVGYKDSGNGKSTTIYLAHPEKELEAIGIQASGAVDITISSITYTTYDATPSYTVNGVGYYEYGDAFFAANVGDKIVIDGQTYEKYRIGSDVFTGTASANVEWNENESTAKFNAAGSATNCVKLNLGATFTNAKAFYVVLDSLTSGKSFGLSASLKSNGTEQIYAHNAKQVIGLYSAQSSSSTDFGMPIDFNKTFGFTFSLKPADGFSWPADNTMSSISVAASIDAVATIKEIYVLAEPGAYKYTVNGVGYPDLASAFTAASDNGEIYDIDNNKTYYKYKVDVAGVTGAAVGSSSLSGLTATFAGSSLDSNKNYVTLNLGKTYTDAQAFLVEFENATEVAFGASAVLTDTDLGTTRHYAHNAKDTTGQYTHNSALAGGMPTNQSTTYGFAFLASNQITGYSFPVNNTMSAIRISAKNTTTATVKNIYVVASPAASVNGIYYPSFEEAYNYVGTNGRIELLSYATLNSPITANSSITISGNYSVSGTLIANENVTLTGGATVSNIELASGKYIIADNYLNGTVTVKATDEPTKDTPVIIVKGAMYGAHQLKAENFVSADSRFVVAKEGYDIVLRLPVSGETETGVNYPVLSQLGSTKENEVEVCTKVPYGDQGAYKLTYTGTYKQAQWWFGTGDSAGAKGIVGLKVYLNPDSVGKKMGLRVEYATSGWANKEATYISASNGIISFGKETFSHPDEAITQITLWSTDSGVEYIIDRVEVQFVEPRMVGASLELGTDLAILYYAEAAAFEYGAYTNPVAYAYVNGEFTKKMQPVLGKDESLKIVNQLIDGVYVPCYEFKFEGITPANMGNIQSVIIEATDPAGNTVRSAPKEMSVQAYGETFAGQTDSLDEDTKKLALLTQAMLNYGAYTETMVTKQPSTVNGSLTPDQQVVISPFGEDLANYGCFARTDVNMTVENVKWYSASLTLNDSIAVNFFFNLDGIESTEGLHAEITYGLNSDTARIEANNFIMQKDGRYRIKFNSMSADDLSSMVSIVIKDTDGNAVSKKLDYSILDYVKNKYETADQNTQNMLFSMIKYIAAVDNYTGGRSSLNGMQDIYSKFGF